VTLKILLLGKNGQLGWELNRALLSLGTLWTIDFPEVDFSHPDTTVDYIFNRYSPDIIINSIAYTNVDLAEKEVELAHLVNATTPGAIAQESRKRHAAFIHISTDFVFDGKKGIPYIETDETNPLNVYGKSKLAGEKAVESLADSYMILRTSWLYSTNRSSYVTKSLQGARNQTIMRAVTDQIGSPTWARSLAEVIGQVIAMGRGDLFEWIHEKSGIYHLGGSGWASRYDWTRAILELDPNKDEQKVKELVPALTNEFPSPAIRPENSSLDCSYFERAFDLRLPFWQDALSLALAP